MTDERDLPMEEYSRAGLEITRGNPEVYKSLWSRRDDVTLANPFGPPVRGWEEVSARLDLAASNYRDGRDYEFENISTVVAPELAYAVEIERVRTRVGVIGRRRKQTSAPTPNALSLRTTRRRPSIAGASRAGSSG